MANELTGRTAELMLRAVLGDRMSTAMYEGLRAGNGQSSAPRFEDAMSEIVHVGWEIANDEFGEGRDRLFQKPLANMPELAFRRHAFGPHVLSVPKL